MESYLFPVEYKEKNHWDEQMITQWKKSKLPYLTFTFNKFKPKTIPSEPFWLNLYYCKSSTEELRYKGCVRFRFQVVDSSDSLFIGPNIFAYKPGENPQKWFLCSSFEEIRKSNSEFLKYQDFQHFEHKPLRSCLRNSIPHVICDHSFVTINTYP